MIVDIRKYRLRKLKQEKDELLKELNAVNLLVEVSKILDIHLHTTNPEIQEYQLSCLVQHIQNLQKRQTYA